MDKIKVSRKLFEALEDVRATTGFEDLLKTVSFGYVFNSKIYKVFNDINVMELAEILVKGYEVEETPEEKLLNIYKDSKENYPGEINFRNGIALALNVLNINIKGIND